MLPPAAISAVHCLGCSWYYDGSLEGMQLTASTCGYIDPVTADTLISITSSSILWPVEERQYKCLG